MAKEILVNQLFSGSYLKEGKNIGHEVINLFKDDEGHNNIFVNDGCSIGGHDIEYIVFVRQVFSNKTAEVIGMAEGLHDISEEEIKQIRYAGASLYHIFDKNTYHGQTEPSSGHVTFRVDTIRFPSHRIFITVDNGFSPAEDTIHLISKKEYVLSRRSRVYYSKDEDEAAYVQLKALITDAGKWDSKKCTEKLIPDGTAQNQVPSFLEVIRKEDDENIFSNLLGYYFNYSHIGFQKYAADPNLLNIPNFDLSFSVLREAKNRVDLWIESDNDIVVIENKIKSGINGITRDDYSQLNKYYDETEKNKGQKRTHYYVFAPNYAQFELDKYNLDGIYKVVRYSDIYKFFIREAATYIADPTFPTFVRGLKRHTVTSLSELEFETMRSRLLQRII